LECGFVPAALGRQFVDEYQKIYERRLEAKRNGDKVTNETLKISLNGTFGKLASKYSVLYSPDLMLAVTLTGQFTLLMLIEWLELAGAETLSANTDGIAIRYPKALQEEVDRVVARFSEISRFAFEFTPYRALAMKDVNNYIAVKPDRTVKVKGIYAPLSLKKNPTAQVAAEAVCNWLAKGIPFNETIRNAPFQDFISARNVTGGGQQEGIYLGKVVRWYQSHNTGLDIRYVSNNNKVPKTDGARACMVLKDKVVHPQDLDYLWYEKEAIKIAICVGCESFLTAEEIALVTPPPKEPKKRGKNGTR
jgi:ribosomal protein S16